MRLRKFFRVSFYKSLLARFCSVGVLLGAVIWLIIMFIYLHSQRSSMYKAGWLPIPKDAGIHPPAPTPAKQMSETEASLFNAFGVVKSLEDKKTRDLGYKRHAFNALVSNNIGDFRDIPDTRHKVCRVEHYEENLPTASIIMCFYNEHKMTLIRSIKSVLERTPTSYLKEIIVVDDYSDFPELEAEELQKELKNHLHYDQLRYVRNERREGLIRARVIGARMAVGDVLIFLDSHIEVNRMWIEPLLQQIKHENASLAVPVIDIINADTFEYTPSPLVRGGFNWGLHFKWENLPEGTLKNESDFKGPFLSPTMAGGLFAVNHDYFKHIGEYDMNMDIWGGENLEISFRVWQCGGSIKILPCSRVGHIFRKRRPYSSPDGTNTWLKNSLRLANIWMDDYKEHFLKHEKQQHKSYDYGDITERLELRKRLQCQSFDWYLKNIYPELRIPGEEVKKAVGPAPAFQPWHSRKRTYIDSYQLRLTGTDLCASVVSPKVKGYWKKRSQLTMTPCSMKGRNQIWYETEKSEIILDKLLCLEAEDSLPLVNKCHEMLGDQQWRHNKSDRGGPIYNMASGTCLRAAEAKEGAGVVLDLCSKHEASTWDIVQLKQA